MKRDRELLIRYGLNLPPRPFSELRIGWSFVWEKHKDMKQPWMQVKISDARAATFEPETFNLRLESAYEPQPDSIAIPLE